MTTLGLSTVQVSPLCFGGNVFGWTVDEKNAFEILDAFVAGGGNFIDTADVYSAWADGNKGGESETLIGKWLHARGNRDKVVIATKVGMLNNKGRRSDLSRAHIIEAVDSSLKRLQTDYIDLYFAHADDEETPLEETLSTFAELVQAGKVRVLGASNYTADRMAVAQQVCQTNSLPRYEVQQPPYSLVNRSVYEGALQDFCVANQVSVVTYSSLGSGFLSGKYRQNATVPQTHRAGGVQQRYYSSANFALLERLDKVAARYQTTNVQVALAWLLTRPGVTAPIASATSVAQTNELLGSLKLKLDPEALQMLNAE